MSTTRRSRVTGLDECPCAGNNLDKLIQPAVLAILARGPVHGYRIVRDLGRMPTFGGRLPDPAGVYRFLKAMEHRGLVTSVWDLSETGPAKRMFDLSRRGRECLDRWAATLEEYRLQIGQLIQSLRRTIGEPSACDCGCRPSKARKVKSASKTARRAKH